MIALCATQVIHEGQRGGQIELVVLVRLLAQGELAGEVGDKLPRLGRR